MDIELSKSYTYSVTLHHHTLGELGKAELQFGNTSFPCATLNVFSRSANIAGVDNLDRLIAVTDEGQRFTLLECDVQQFAIYANYVIGGDILNIRTLAIRFHDLNEWFAPFRDLAQRLNSTQNESGSLNHIDIRISTENQQISLESKSVLSTWREGENDVVHEHFEFHFSRMDGYFSPSDLLNRVRELSTLLSILLGLPVYLRNLRVCGPENIWSGLFFPHYQKPESKKRATSHFEFFASRPLLDAHWQEIFQNFYRSDLKEVSWTRLAGIKHYEGFWEYRLLGHVTLLDKYVSLQCAKLQPSVPTTTTKRENNFKASLNKIHPRLSSSQIDQIETSARNIFISNRKMDFGEKFDFVLDQSDQVVRGIIGFSASDFKLIKDLRDKISHGDIPTVPDNDFTCVETLVNKITLLLTYFAFVDFGLPAAVFIKCFNGLSSLHRHADIDESALLQYQYPERFIELSEEDFISLQSMISDKTALCFVRDVNGALRYSGVYSERLRNFNKTTVAPRTTFATIFGVDDACVQHWPMVSFACKGERIKLHSVFVISTA